MSRLFGELEQSQITVRHRTGGALDLHDVEGRATRRVRFAAGGHDAPTQARARCGSADTR